MKQLLTILFFIPLLAYSQRDTLLVGGRHLVYNTPISLNEPNDTLFNVIDSIADIQRQILIKLEMIRKRQETMKCFDSLFIHAIPDSILLQKLEAIKEREH